MLRLPQVIAAADAADPAVFWDFIPDAWFTQASNYSYCQEYGVFTGIILNLIVAGSDPGHVPSVQHDGCGK